MRVPCPHDLNKCCDLVAMPMFRVHFILNLKGVIFSKVNDKDHGVTRENLKACLELLILLFYNKTMFHKKL